MAEEHADAIRRVLSRWGFSDLFTGSEQADRFIRDLEYAVGARRLDEDKRLNDEGIPAWFVVLKKFKFGDHDGDGTLEMNIAEDGDERGTFVRFIEAGDDLADLMRAAWMEVNPVVMKKRLDNDT